MSFSQKNFKLVPPAPVRVPSQMSRQARLSANDKGASEMIPGLCTDLLAFILQLRKTPKNLSWETVDEGCVTSHRLQ